MLTTLKFRRLLAPIGNPLARFQDSDEHLAIDSELLCEIEAESWINGTRGILVESRAPPLPKLEQNCSLLPSTADDRGSKAVKAAARAKAAAALDKEGAAVLYSMPWQKLDVSALRVGALSQ